MISIKNGIPSLLSNVMHSFIPRNSSSQVGKLIKSYKYKRQIFHSKSIGDVGLLKNRIFPLYFAS